MNCEISRFERSVRCVKSVNLIAKFSNFLVVSAFLILACGATVARSQGNFDHEHRAWSALLAKHVLVRDSGSATQVRYRGFAADRAALKAYLDSLSRVTPADYAGWSKPQQLAFLINAYNAFTVEKILTRYPNLKSIRDFGTVFGNPWKDRFFMLLGKSQNLDGIEHETIRAPGAFEEPRIHFAVNCAAVGCPALREEAYTAARIDAQLEDQTRRFLGDRSRNRFTAGTLEVSRIFDWYVKDFSLGWKGFASPQQFFAKYADLLADRDEDRQLLRDGRLPIRYLDYDWMLNDASG